MSAGRTGFVAYAALAAMLVAADQAVKSLVLNHMEFYQQIDLLPFFGLFRTQNTGIAFSMLDGLGPLGLLALSAAIVTFIGWLMIQTKPDQTIARTGFAMIVAGALGNMIDRATLGHVVDYFLFHTADWSFAVFNLADAFITVGAGLVILDEFLVWRAGGKSPDDSGD